MYTEKRETGLEPATYCLEGNHSTTELLPQKGQGSTEFKVRIFPTPRSSWPGGTQLYPQLSELPSWIVPTRTTTESVKLYYTHLSIRTPPQGIAYIIFSNEKHSVTGLYAAHDFRIYVILLSMPPAGLEPATNGLKDHCSTN